MNPTWITAVQSGEDRSLKAGVCRGALAVAEPGYRAAVAVRNRMFDRGARRIVRLPRPVVSVGNLTTGGTGKTPMVAAIAARLLERGGRPAILTRGYKAGRAGSDEAALLADLLGEAVPVAANPDRAAAAESLLRERPGITAFILDDGFQHRCIHRDLDLVLIDATLPFGFGRLLPRGLLREPVVNLRRADAVIVTRADAVSPQAVRGLDAEIERLCGRRPVGHSRHDWVDLHDAAGVRHELAVLRGKRVVAVCGIGRPAAFLDAVRRHTGAAPEPAIFADHHHYTARDVANVQQRARQVNADAIVMTEKDWVKWRRIREVGPAAIPFYTARIMLGFLEKDDPLRPLLAALMGSHVHGK